MGGRYSGTGKPYRTLRQRRAEINWRIEQCGPTKVKVIEPGGDHEWIFEGVPHPYDDALAFVGARLRGQDTPEG